MTDDIIARLNEVWEYAPTYPWQRNAINDAKAEIERLRMERDDLQVLLRGRTAEFQAEIERLRAALTLAVGELSTHTQYAIYSPDQLLEQFMQEARRER